MSDSFMDLVNSWQGKGLQDSSKLYESKFYINFLNVAIKDLTKQSLVFASDVLSTQDSWAEIDPNTIHYFNGLGNGAPLINDLATKEGLLINLDLGGIDLKAQLVLGSNGTLAFRTAYQKFNAQTWSFFGDTATLNRFATAQIKQLMDAYVQDNVQDKFDSLENDIKRVDDIFKNDVLITLEAMIYYFEDIVKDAVTPDQLKTTLALYYTKEEGAKLGQSFYTKVETDAKVKELLGLDFNLDTASKQDIVAMIAKKIDADKAVVDNLDGTIKVNHKSITPLDAHIKVTDGTDMNTLVDNGIYILDNIKLVNFVKANVLVSGAVQVMTVNTTTTQFFVGTVDNKSDQLFYVRALNGGKWSNWQTSTGTGGGSSVDVSTLTFSDALGGDFS